MEEEKIREKALLTDEEMGEIIRINHDDKPFKSESQIARSIAQAQVDKFLKTDGIRIEAENQDPPKIYNQKVYTESNRMTERAFLTPKDGKVWVRCLVKEEE